MPMWDPNFYDPTVLPEKEEPETRLWMWTENDQDELQPGIPHLANDARKDGGQASCIVR
jgi:hypothetical protein